MAWGSVTMNRGSILRRDLRTGRNAAMSGCGAHHLPGVWRSDGSAPSNERSDGTYGKGPRYRPRMRCGEHHNTEHPPAHVVVRGVRSDGDGLRLSRHYIQQGIRSAAEHLCTRQLGYSRLCPVSPLALLPSAVYVAIAGMDYVRRAIGNIRRPYHAAHERASTL
jgi:hypothetical protein